jgi:hypothetical protein
MKKVILTLYGSSLYHHLKKQDLLTETQVFNVGEGEWPHVTREEIKSATKDIIVVCIMDVCLFDTLLAGATLDMYDSGYEVHLYHNPKDSTVRAQRALEPSNQIARKLILQTEHEVLAALN